MICELCSKPHPVIFTQEAEVLGTTHTWLACAKCLREDLANVRELKERAAREDD